MNAARGLLQYVEDDGKGGEERRDISTHLFDFFDLFAAEFAKRATLRYGLPRNRIERPFLDLIAAPRASHMNAEIPI